MSAAPFGAHRNPVGSEEVARTTLHVDEIDLLVHLLLIDVLPVVLDTGPHVDTLHVRDAAFRGAHATLASAGLIDGVIVHPDLARCLRTLARPRSEIALRRRADGTVLRACLALAQDRRDAVLALRSDDTFTIEHPGHDLVSPLVRTLGTVEPLRFGTLNCPTADLGATLDGSSDPQKTADHLVAAGLPAAEAAVVGPALDDCTTVAELVGLVHEDGHPALMHGPVTVFDTADGRIVGTTSVADDGVRQTSLRPGTPGRLRQAVEALLAQLG